MSGKGNPVGSRTGVIRLFKITLLVLLFAIGLRAQSVPATQSPNSPDEGFVSPSKYTNAFFGFALPIPEKKSVRLMSLPSHDPLKSFLFGLTSNERGLSVFIVTAAQTAGASSEDARKAACGPKGESATRIEVGGKEFWKSESHEKAAGGKMRTVKYAAALPGYVLSFSIASFDGKFTDEIERAIESVTFFDPSKAKEIAGADSHPENLGAATSQSGGGKLPVPSTRIRDLSTGTISENVYANSALGFSYEFPAGWYLADKATQERLTDTGHQATWGNSASAAREHESVQNCSKVLLWANKYPVGTQTENINPMVIVVAVDPDCFPGSKFPTSIDDQGSAKEIGEAMVRSFQGSQLPMQEMKLAILTVQGHIFVDVTGVGHVPVLGHPAPVEVHAATLLTTVSNLWIGWLFGSGSKVELQELKNTKLTFSNPTIVP
jgi:hypothetical protein